jgi:hypothetical protein
MRWIGLMAGLALAGCGEEAFQRRVLDRFTEPPPLPARPEDSCYSQMFQKYVGQSASVLDGLVFVQPVRIVLPDESVGPDYSPVRINFDTDRAGLIARVWCG